MMRAVYFEQFGGPVTVERLPDPIAPDDGVVIRVMASGLCRSDWHGWMGHDDGIVLPHVPGHEFAGEVVEVGSRVVRWRSGDRVTAPFCCGCGNCAQCFAGQHQVCENQFQPGFTHFGSFAEYVAIERADVNLVALPDTMAFVTAASLGCRFTTAFRALVDQGRLRPGEWLAVHGCGGVGLSALMIAKALGARVAAIDINDEALRLAAALGADATLDASASGFFEDLRARTGGGAHVSIDALGNPTTCFNSVSCLRTRGRHVQVGLLLGDHARTALPMDQVVAKELEILGSHGMQAHRFGAVFSMIESGVLDPGRLVTRRLDLAGAAQALPAMSRFEATGMAVIDRF